MVDQNFPIPGLVSGAPTLNFNPGYTEWGIKLRVDTAEEYVERTGDPIDTYVAAAIAIQCAGLDSSWNPFGTNYGIGIAQISVDQASTPLNRPITNGSLDVGLGNDCSIGERMLNPESPSDSVLMMKRRIQEMFKLCTKCTDTDRYIAAALAQNGPGFPQSDMKTMRLVTPDVSKQFTAADGTPPNINKDWFFYFSRSEPVNTKVQLRHFNPMIRELQIRGWVIPPRLDFNVIYRLSNWDDFQ